METVLPVENETLLEIERLTNLMFDVVHVKVDSTPCQYYLVRVFEVEDDGTRTELYLGVRYFMRHRHSDVSTKEKVEEACAEMLSTGDYGFLMFPRPDGPSVPVDIGLPTFSTIDELRMKLGLLGAS